MQRRICGLCKAMFTIVQTPNRYAYKASWFLGTFFFAVALFIHCCCSAFIRLMFKLLNHTHWYTSQKSQFPSTCMTVCVMTWKMPPAGSKSPFPASLTDAVSIEPLAWVYSAIPATPTSRLTHLLSSTVARRVSKWLRPIQWRGILCSSRFYPILKLCSSLWGISHQPCMYFSVSTHTPWQYQWVYAAMDCLSNLATFGCQLVIAIQIRGAILHGRNWSREFCPSQGGREGGTWLSVMIGTRNGNLFH